MIKVIISIGLNHKTTKRQEISSAEAFKTVTDQAARVFVGATVSDVKGVYRHEDGATVIENTIKVELILQDEELTKAREFAEDMKTRFIQECVMFEIMPVQVEFI